MVSFLVKVFQRKVATYAKNNKIKEVSTMRIDTMEIRHYNNGTEVYINGKYTNMSANDAINLARFRNMKEDHIQISNSIWYKIFN